MALGTTQISSYFTKHWTKFLTHQRRNYPVTCFVSKSSGITSVELSIINTSYQKLPFGSGDDPDKLFFFIVHAFCPVDEPVHWQYTQYPVYCCWRRMYGISRAGESRACVLISSSEGCRIRATGRDIYRYMVTFLFRFKPKWWVRWNHHARKSGWAGFVAAYFLLIIYKTNPNPRENICCVGKSVPKCHFLNLVFLGLGWPWVGEFVGFILIFRCFPTQHNLVNRKHPIYGGTH